MMPQKLSSIRPPTNLHLPASITQTTAKNSDDRIQTQLPSPPLRLDEKQSQSSSTSNMDTPSPSFILNDKTLLTEEPESIAPLISRTKRLADDDGESSCALGVGLERPSKRRSTDSTTDPSLASTFLSSASAESSDSSFTTASAPSSTLSHTLVALKKGGPEALWANVTTTSIDMKYLYQYIRTGGDLNAANPDSRGLLYLAIKNKSLEAVRLLLQTPKIEINTLNGPEKETPLHAAAQLNLTDAIELLLECGAYLDALDAQKHSPLYGAVFSKSLEATRLLISLGADTTIRDAAGNNLLHIAVSQNQPEFLKLLLADPRCLELINTPNLAVMTPLANSITLAHSECMHELILHGADLSTRSRNGKTLLHIAVHWNRMDALETLVATGCDLNITNDNDETPLYLATQHAKIEMVQFLIAKGADPCFPKMGSSTTNHPLLYAAAHGYFEMCALLATDTTPERVILMAVQMASRGAGVGAETTGVLYRILMGRRERERRQREREGRERNKMENLAIRSSSSSSSTYSTQQTIAPATISPTLPSVSLFDASDAISSDNFLNTPNEEPVEGMEIEEDGTL